MPTALEFLHAIAEDAGQFGTFTTTSGGSTTTAVVSDLVNSVLAASEFANFWLLAEDGACAGQVGTLTNSGLARSTGTLTTADAFTSAIAGGTAISLYDGTRLPPLRKGARRGTLQISNEALTYLWAERTISIAGVSGQQRYGVDQSLYPWWTDRDRIIEIRYPTTTSDAATAALDESQWYWEQNGHTRQLVFPGAPFSTGETFTVQVYAPATSELKLNATARAVLSTTTVGSVALATGGYYTVVPTVSFSGGGGTGAAATAVLTGGVVTAINVTNPGTGYTGVPVVTLTRNASDVGWANQTSQSAGLRALTDEALPDVLDIKTVGLYLTFRALAAMPAPGATVAEWLAKAQEWRGEMVHLEHFGRPSNQRTGVASLRPVVVGGRQWQRSVR